MTPIPPTVPEADLPPPPRSPGARWRRGTITSVMASREEPTRGRSAARAVTTHRWRAGVLEASADQVAAEEALQLCVDGAPLAVVLRTPGDDVDLALGLLHAEGVIRTRHDVALVRTAPSGQGALEPRGVSIELLPEVENLVDIRLVSPLPPGRLGWQRALPASSACGLCGSVTLDAVAATCRPVASMSSWSVAALCALPDRLSRGQAVFARTGGLHAAALVDAEGATVLVREDVGRHNAVDKLVGWGLRHDALPLSTHLLLVSGRAGFEIVQKAAAAGLGVVAAVSAPSSLAVETAERLGVTLVGFLRDDHCNVYSHPGRITGTDRGPAAPRG